MGKKRKLERERGEEGCYLHSPELLDKKKDIFGELSVLYHRAVTCPSVNGPMVEDRSWVLLFGMSFRSKFVIIVFGLLMCLSVYFHLCGVSVYGRVCGVL